MEQADNCVDELMTPIERKEIVQMIKDEYENKTVKGNYLVCSCAACKHLLVPFLIRRDFEELHPELREAILVKHKQYID